MRKEMFALRQTLSFHEQCGCPGMPKSLAGEAAAPAARPPPPAASALAYQGEKSVPLVHQSPLYAQHENSRDHSSNAIGAAGDACVSATSGSPPQQGSAQQGNGPALMSSHKGMGLGPQYKQSYHAPHTTSLNASSADGTHCHPKYFSARPTLGGHDIERPGSAGPSFGHLTPNYAELLGKTYSRSGSTTTPGGNALPNNFGLSMQDIPVRPASAPPTPSPALDPRLSAPGADYFSSKTGGGSAMAQGVYNDLFLATMGFGVHSAQPPLIA